MRVLKITLLLVLILLFREISAQSTYYVSLSGSNSSPYSSLATGANDIQTAVDAASNGDLILVDNGTYVLTANISVTKGVIIRSINGKSYVTVDGNNAVRCFYINHVDAVIDGLKITRGYNPGGFGGGVNIANGGTIQNCLISGNQARDGGGVAIDTDGLVFNCVIANNLADTGSGTTGYGGGVRMLNGGTTRNCLVHSNTSANLGGGINIWNAGTIQSCTVTNNTAPNGAGVRCRNASLMENTISYFNIGLDVQLSGGGYLFYNNCTTNSHLLPGSGNTSADPLFGFNPPSLNPFLLSSSSTLIDAGLNQAWMTGAFDYDGNNRIINGTVDIGAFEHGLPNLLPPTLVYPGGPLPNPGTPTNYPLNLTLKWNPVTGAYIYKVQLTLASDTAFSSPIIDTWAGYGDTSYSVTNLQYFTDYIWRVYAHNATTLQSSDWSTPFIFATLLAPPVLISPSNNEAGVSINPTLTWHRSNGAHFHTYEVYSDQGCTNLVVSGSTPWAPLDTVVTLTTNLANNTSYYWRVKPVAVLFSGDYSEVRKFTTINAVVPYLTWPIGGATVYSSSQMLFWYPGIPGPGLKYDLLYSTNPSMTSPTIITDITSTSYNLTGLSGSTTYFWQVRSKTVAGEIISYSTIESFQTIPFYTGPAVPIPSWPVGGAIVYTNSPTLYWYLGTFGTGLTYEVEYTTGVLMGSPNIIGITTTNTTLPGLNSGTTFHWQVRSFNGVDYSDWSVQQSFQTVASPTPLVPVPSWPIGGPIVYTVTPTLYWYLNGPGAGLTYEAEYSTGSLVGSPNITGINSTNVELTGLSVGTTYNWQVRSTDGVTYSDWSVQQSFVTYAVSTGPIKPIPSWPVGGAFVYTDSPTLNWYLGATATGLTYEVEYSTGALDGSPDVTGITSLNTTLGGLAGGTTYNWQVRSTDGITYSDWSVQESFKTVGGTGGPTVPYPSWPIGGATVYTNSPTLNWYLGTSATGITYDVRYSTDPGMSSAILIPGISALSTSLGGLTSGATYYWQVRSTDGLVYSAYSTPQSFTTSANNLSVVPLPGSPAGGVTIATNSATLSWILPTASPGLTYELQYSTDPVMLGAANVFVESSSENINGLQSGKTYYWRIRSKTVNGETSSFSNIERFKVSSVTSTEEVNEEIPTEYALTQNYPNPFNPTTTISFSLPGAGYYSLTVYNIIGQKVATLVAENMDAGTYNVVFDAGRLSSGLYLYRLSGENVSLTRKMVLVK